ncbi:hypothetical protein PCAR4_190057 [Paraburkholderia caribensis]|nr:hypothetical protein PCAR4_190057 [Paraburkholderia caribensis]
MQEVGQIEASARVVGAELHWNGLAWIGRCFGLSGDAVCIRHIGTVNVQWCGIGAFRYPKNGHIPVICLIFPFEIITTRAAQKGQRKTARSGSASNTPDGLPPAPDWRSVRRAALCHGLQSPT